MVGQPAGLGWNGPRAIGVRGLSAAVRLAPGLVDSAPVARQKTPFQRSTVQACGFVGAGSGVRAFSVLAACVHLAAACALAQAPIDPVVRHVERGEVALARGEPQRAEQAFRAALAADPDRVEARRGLARALAEQERYDEALDVWGFAQRDAPVTPAVRAELCLLIERVAEARLGVSDGKIALDRIERGERAGCGGPSLNALRARALLAEATRARSAQRIGEAAELFRAAASADPSRAESWYAAAEMLLRAGRRREALALLSQALTRHPDDLSLRALMVEALGNRLLKPPVER